VLYLTVVLRAASLFLKLFDDLSSCMISDIIKSMVPTLLFCANHACAYLTFSNVASGLKQIALACMHCVIQLEKLECMHRKNTMQHDFFMLSVFHRFTIEYRRKLHSIHYIVVKGKYALDRSACTSIGSFLLIMECEIMRAQLHQVIIHAAS